MLFSNPEADCRLVLAPHASALAEIPRRAWDRFQSLPAKARLALSASPRARANAVHAFMVEEANRDFAHQPGVQRVTVPNSVGYLVDDAVFLRFKLLDAQRLSRNFPTKRATLFNQNLSLPDVPAAAFRVDVGYRLNMLQTDVRDVLVVHRSGPRVQWTFSLDEPADVIVLPFQHSLDHDLAELPAIRARSEEDTAHRRRQATDNE